MVWGMSIPSSFGDFWPEGEFEGLDKNFNELWRQRLDRYYQSLPLDEQKALFDYSKGGDVTQYPTYVSQKFKNEIGTRPDDFREMAPLNSFKPHEPPQSFVTSKGYTSLASLIKFNNRILAVDEALKEIIERFEPGMHQFFPIEIRMPRAKVYPVQYYTLAIGQYINGFVPEKSKQGSYREYGPEYPDYYSLIDSRKEISGLAHSKSALGKAHLWRERDLNGALICFSDELESAIVGAGLRLPKHYRMMEV
jgi:hypothetical protein